MRRTHIIINTSLGVAIVITALLGAMFPASAESANTPSLAISHLKITSSSGQFVTLYNSTNTAIDTAKYQLVYFNNYDVSKATTSRLVALSGVVPPHSYELISDATSQLCYQMTVMAASLGFSTTVGFLELQLVSQAVVGGPITTSTVDYVGWSKTTAAGVQTLPASTSAFMVRTPLSAQNNPIVNNAGDGSWLAVQPDSTNACEFVAVTTGKTIAVYGSLLAATAPPANYEAETNPTSGQVVNDGLMTPVINELLPNPLGTGNDATDEYIELFNPNAATFDLSGYELRTGTTTQHTFVFPAGSQLPAQSFTAFYAAATGLVLSNTSGQASLYDPTGIVLSSTDVYDTAKDGYVWALANNKWQWSTNPTPSAINVIRVPPVTKKRATTSKSTKATPSTKTANVSNVTAGLVKGASTQTGVKDSNSIPIHPWILALVASVALLYGAYEFRNDLAHGVTQCRRYLSNRFRDWRTFAWWRSHRTDQ